MLEKTTPRRRAERIVAELLHSTQSTVKGYRSKEQKGNFLGLFSAHLEKAQAFGLDNDLTNKLLKLHTKVLLDLKLEEEGRRWTRVRAAAAAGGGAVGGGAPGTWTGGPLICP